LNGSGANQSLDIGQPNDLKAVVLIGELHEGNLQWRGQR
jgi:hypothetical protein